MSGRLLPLILAIGCASGCAMTELEAPLASSSWVKPGAWIVLTNHDLQRLSQSARDIAGKSLTVSLPSVEVGSNSLAGATLHVQVEPGAVSISPEQDLTVTYPLAAAPISMAWQAPGRAACALQWAWSGAALELSLRFARDSEGQVDVTLLQAPQILSDVDPLSDPAGCLSEAPVGTLTKLRSELKAAVTFGLAASYVEAAREALLTVLPRAIEVQGQSLPQTDRQPLAAGVRYSAPEGALTSLLRHNGSYAAAALDVAFDASVHACAEDKLPPATVPSPLAVLPPPAPSSGTVLRRALVLDRAVLARSAWAVARSGHLCARIDRGLESYLPATWAVDTAPSLGALVEPGPVGGQFWPGGSPEVRVLQSDKGALVEWKLPDALLEVTAPVAGVELVVLQVEGTFRVDLAAVIGTSPRLSVVGARVDSARLSSPLVPGKALEAGDGLTALVRAAFMGIFSEGVGFTSGESLGVLVGSDRIGDHLWLWLSGGTSNADAG